jgi:DNA topoisomerase-1
MGRSGNNTAERSLKVQPPAAAEAGLVYASDVEPGIRRVRKGKGFTYSGPDGKRVTDRATLERIGGLVIPPAWKDVWISTRPRGHLQATGRDARAAHLPRNLARGS